MWTHNCRIYNSGDSWRQVVTIEDDKNCHWCGLSRTTSEQLDNGNITEDKQFLQEINEHGQ